MNIETSEKALKNNKRQQNYFENYEIIKIIDPKQRKKGEKEHRRDKMNRKTE